jgi:beta-lactamase superfamily II metal-dependent hydrolase
MFTVEMLPASLGDALWVEYGDPAHPSRFLIDGGLVGTVDTIEERIREAADKDGGRCRLELLVLSHVDADHIEGLIKLLGTKDLPLDIDDLWFNGWRHLPEPDASKDAEFLGAKQGEFLAALIRERGLPWNKAFDGDTVYVPRPEKGPLPRHTLPGGMELVLMSPTFEELLKLSKRWEEELEDAGLLHATHEELLEALKKERKLAPDEEFLSEEEIDVEALVESRERHDTSPANGSSIAFVGSFDGKRCLFSGDAYWSVLRDSAVRLAQEERAERLALDAFKLPHHGSRNNIGDGLLAALDCRRFLISTNGSRFKHPDTEAIARLVGGTWRPDPKADEAVEVIFNYRTKFNEDWDDSGLRSTWNYEPTYPEDGSEGLVVKL